MKWGEKNPEERGPVICSSYESKTRNAIGAHSGSYSVYRALYVADDSLDPNHTPDYTGTDPVIDIGGPYESWSKIASMDPFGHQAYKLYNERPTIAITKAHIDFPEVKLALRDGRLKPDGKVLLEDGQVKITKVAVDPVWHLPSIARRLGIPEITLRQSLFYQCGGSYHELLSRPDLHLFLPPIGGITCYIFGEDHKNISNPDVELTVRVHDECNGSDVFGSDICTCRPYLAHAIEDCIKTAQRGGNGLVVYFRKEGRALGEVTKYLVYNARKAGGADVASEYFNRTVHVAGIEDARCQALMADVLHWFGITKIDHLISMSNVKYDAITQSGIQVINRVPIPEYLIPKDAQVEIAAKVYAGYDGGDVHSKKSKEELEKVQGR